MPSGSSTPCAQPQRRLVALATRTHEHSGLANRLMRASAESDVVDAEVMDPKLKSILEEDERADEGYLFCAACSHVIGHVNDRFEVDGSFEHHFVNPYGFPHHFGCYREAHGCAIVGGPQAADSWFPGFRWRLADCGGCGIHMGWLFERDDAHFFGLILHRIQAG